MALATKEANLSSVEDEETISDTGISDKHHLERLRQYHEEQKLLKEAEEKKRQEEEEEAMKMRENISRLEEEIKETEKQISQNEDMGRQIDSEHLQLIKEKTNSTCTDTAKDLHEAYKDNLRGYQWHSSDYARCRVDIQYHQETLAKELEQTKKASLKNIRKDMEEEQKELERKHSAELKEIQLQYLSAQADYNKKKNQALRMKQPVPEESEKMSELKTKAAELKSAYEESSDKLSENQNSSITATRESYAAFDKIAAGDDPFPDQQASDLFNDQREAIRQNDHERAVLYNKKAKQEMELIRAKEDLRNIDKKMSEQQAALNTKISEDRMKKQVMEKQIGRQVNNHDKQEAVKSVISEIDSTIQDIESSLKTARDRYEEKVCNLAQEGKLQVAHSEREAAALKKKLQETKTAFPKWNNPSLSLLVNFPDYAWRRMPENYEK